MFGWVSTQKPTEILFPCPAAENIEGQRPQRRAQVHEIYARYIRFSSRAACNLYRSQPRTQNTGQDRLFKAADPFILLPYLWAAAAGRAQQERSECGTARSPGISSVSAPSSRISSWTHPLSPMQRWSTCRWGKIKTDEDFRQGRMYQIRGFFLCSHQHQNSGAKCQAVAPLLSQSCVIVYNPTWSVSIEVILCS